MSDQHTYLTGNNLGDAIKADNLSWDPSIEALVPFPSVLDMMASDVSCTRQLGDAVLAQPPEVMDAVQRMRRKARDFGYLQDGPQYRVLTSGPGVIEILPVDPAFYYVPIYDPLVVFGRPPAWEWQLESPSALASYRAGFRAMGMAPAGFRMGVTHDHDRWPSVAACEGESCRICAFICGPLPAS